MLRGLWRLTWLEIKIFVREPLGVFGAGVPVLIFLVLGRVFGPRVQRAAPGLPRFVSVASAPDPKARTLKPASSNDCGPPRCGPTPSSSRTCW